MQIITFSGMGFSSRNDFTVLRAMGAANSFGKPYTPVLIFGNAIVNASQT